MFVFKKKEKESADGRRIDRAASLYFDKSSSSSFWCHARRPTTTTTPCFDPLSLYLFVGFRILPHPDLSNMILSQKDFSFIFSWRINVAFTFVFFIRRSQLKAWKWCGFQLVLEWRGLLFKWSLISMVNITSSWFLLLFVYVPLLFIVYARLIGPKKFCIWNSQSWFFVHPIVVFWRLKVLMVVDCGRWISRETNARNEQEEINGCEKLFKTERNVSVYELWLALQRLQLELKSFLFSAYLIHLIYFYWLIIQVLCCRWSL